MGTGEWSFVLVRLMILRVTLENVGVIGQPGETRPAHDRKKYAERNVLPILHVKVQETQNKLLKMLHQPKSPHLIY